MAAGMKLFAILVMGWWLLSGCGDVDPEVDEPPPTDVPPDMMMPPMPKEGPWLRWVARFGDSVTDSAEGVAIEPGGQVTVTGTFSGAIQIGGTTLASSNTNSMMVARYDAQGAPVYARALRATSLTASTQIAVDADGNAVIGGHYMGTPDFGLPASVGSTDAFGMRLSASGATLMAKAWGGTGTDQWNAAAIAPSGDLYMTGRITGTVDLGGVIYEATTANTLWGRFSLGGTHRNSRMLGSEGCTDAGHSLAVDSAGNAIIAGPVGADPTACVFGMVPPLHAVPTMMRDLFVTKLSSDGTHVATAFFTGPSAESTPRVAVDAQGNLWLAMAASGSLTLPGGRVLTLAGYDVVVVKLDPLGGLLGALVLGGPGDESSVMALKADGERGVIVALSLDGAADLGGGVVGRAGSADVVLVGVGPEVRHRWSYSFGGEGNDRPRSLAITGDRLVVAGRYGEAMTIDGTVVPNQGGSDGFVAVFDLPANR